MLNYLLQLTLAWSAFYLLYQLLLRRTTFFGYNRAYLLATLLLGLVLPLYDWGALFVDSAPLEQAGYYLQPITIGVQQMEIVVTEQAAQPTTVERPFTWAHLGWLAYGIGVALAAARLLYGGWQLWQLYRSGHKEEREGYTLVRTPSLHTPFSFFRWLFWSDVLPCPAKDRDKILRHERAHMQGWHSADVLLLELLSVLLWFHPLLYLYGRSLRNVHEYLADAAVLHHVKKKPYGHLLLRQSQTGQAVALANHFSHKQLKKRILMMTKKRSPRLQRLWYALALPLVAVLAFAFAMPTEGTPISAEEPLPLTLVDGDAETLPVFAGCEGAGDAEAQQACTKQKLMAFMGQKLKYPAEAKKAGKEGMVVVEFKVQADGTVDDIKVLKSAGYGMDEAAVAVVEAMPRWTPGKDEDGNAVATKLTLPFSFKLPSAPLEGEVFKVVEEMPRFPGCEEETDAQAREKCAQQLLLEFVYDKLEYPEEARQAGISGIVVAQFIIDKAGQVKNPKIVRSIGGGTDEAVLKVINKMPDWVPGKHRGRLVNVEFNLPIRFQLPAEEDHDEAEDGASHSSDVLNVAEEMPRFPGCEDIADKRERQQCANRRMLEFVYSNVKYPKDARNERIQGTGVIKLIIGKTGEVERYGIARSIHPSLDAELDRIARLIQDEVQWIPGKEDGNPVKVAFMLPIKFKLTGEQDESNSLKIDTEDKPLLVVDGERLPNFTSLDDILDPSDIKSITVLKDEKALEKYGKAGQNGVVEIETKPGTRLDIPALPSTAPSQELELSNFSATPNPTEGGLQVRFEAAAAPTLLRVLDLNGKELLRRPLTQFQGGMAEETLDLSGLPSGMVLLEVRQGEQVFVERVMVK